MTLTTETIKTQVSGEAWMKQRRAEIKWECYSKLAEDLGELATLLQEVRFIQRRGPAPGFDQAALDQQDRAESSRRKRRDGETSSVRLDRPDCRSARGTNPPEYLR